MTAYLPAGYISAHLFVMSKETTDSSNLHLTSKSAFSFPFLLRQRFLSAQDKKQSGKIWY